MRRLVGSAAIVVLALCVLLAWAPSKSYAGIGDMLKKKVEDKVTKKVEKKIDEAGEKAAEDSTQAAEGAEGESAEEGVAAGAAGGTATSEDMALYTKYDFVPGDKVIFYDDLSGDEIGEFPSRWNLDNGVFEVVKQGGENWIMCSDQGFVRPRVAAGALPPKYTVELEFYSKGPGHRGHWCAIEWMDAEDTPFAMFQITDDLNTVLRINHVDKASKQLPAYLSAGKHTMRIMATTSTIKCYIDHERVANVPAVEGFAPVGLRVHMDPWTDEEGNPMLMRGFRFAEGGKTLKQQLDETGRIVTHGILFDSGSDKIKAESFKTLADIGQLLTENPELRLSIEGHTDSDGADDYNMALSQKRASAVRAYLMDAYKIDAGRLEAKGLGETKPMDVNTTPEGKANNRRVELVRL
ncbi:MAG: OmpA family protein [bacterium]